MLYRRGAQSRVNQGISGDIWSLHRRITGIVRNTDNLLHYRQKAHITCCSHHINYLGVVMPSDNNLHKAAHKGDLDECRRYIEGAGAEEGEELIDINEPGASDRRALHRCAGAGHLNLCVYFIEKNAQIDLADKSGRTALLWAAISGHTDIVKFLLEKGANILAETTSKMNALHGAVEGGRVDTVRALMEFVQGKEELKLALTTAKNGDNKTAWDISTASKNKALCQILKELGDANSASSTCTLC